jgi:hypothetical protein
VLSDLVEELGDFAECTPCAALVFESGGVNDEMFGFVDLSIDYLASFRSYLRMGNWLELEALNCRGSRYLFLRPRRDQMFP